MIAAVLFVVAALAPSCYTPPINAAVVDPFRAPDCPYCAGNRGLEYEPVPGSVVRAAAAGTVEFSGTVVRVRYVVVRQSDGLRASYGFLATTDLRLGDRVSPGQRIGTTTRRFFFGLRDGERYIDPQPFLGTLVGTPRLVPIDGSAPRAAPTPRLRCRGGQ
jgi:murein DD-endopeptidase MepM/ murein hydrolase activator NlpD